MLYKINHAYYLGLISIGFLLALAVLSGCQKDNLDTVPTFVPRDLWLSEYREDGDVVLEFIYEEDTLLKRQKQLFPQGLVDFEMQYNNFNYKPSAMTAHLNSRSFQNYFNYNSEGTMIGYTFFIDTYISYVVRLYFNAQGFIYKLQRFRPLDHELSTRIFEWKDGNVVRIEDSSNFVDPDNPSIIEFVYDQKKNPFNTMFEVFGFNVIEHMPLTKNNPLEIKTYRKKTPNKYSLVRTKYAYNRDGYPFVKESKIKDRLGNERSIYAEYIY